MRLFPIEGHQEQNHKRTSEVFPPDMLRLEGLLGLFIAECERSAPERRQPAYALAMALCVVGALAGRRYKSETDLRTNVYTAILGQSSSGKGHAQKVAGRLLHDAGLSHYLAGDYQSGSGLQTELVEHPVRLAIVDEFGVWLSSISGERAPKHLVDIKKKLMTLFSSADSVIAGGSYADSQARSRKDIKQPHLCFFGAGTPDHFFNALQSGALKDGFIPRFLIFQPDHFLPKLVDDPQSMEISDDMISAAHVISGVSPSDGNLAGIVRMQYDESVEAILVRFSPDGRAEHGKWTRRREGILQGGCVGFSADELVGKWREHATKLAMIRAISRDPRNPVMDAACVAWGWELAERCIRTVSRMAERHIADNRTEADNKRLRNIIADAGPDGVMKHDLIQRTRFLDTRARGMILHSLIEGGEVKCERVPAGPSGGRPGERFRLAS